MGDEEETEYKIEYQDGEMEEVNWLKRAGRARVTYPNGHTFEGTFDKDKKKQGKGVYSWMRMNEETESYEKYAWYEGNYKDGKRDGVGKMKYPSGDVYHGEWVADKRQGEGTYVFANGDIYSGGWLADVKSGTGSYQFVRDSSQLQGTWENNKIQKGRWLFTDGSEYVGSFVDGKPLGEGMFVFSNGIQQAGEYVRKAAPGEVDDEAEAQLVWNGREAQNIVVA